MSSAILARITKLESRRRPISDIRSKEERDAAVKMALADPEWLHTIGMQLLGGYEQAGDRQRHAAILAAWQADK